jgi:hypothetical protein
MGAAREAMRIDTTGEQELSRDTADAERDSRRRRTARCQDTDTGHTGCV